MITVSLFNKHIKNRNVMVVMLCLYFRLGMFLTIPPMRYTVYVAIQSNALAYQTQTFVTFLSHHL